MATGEVIIDETTLWLMNEEDKDFISSENDPLSILFNKINDTEYEKKIILSKMRFVPYLK